MDPNATLQEIRDLIEAGMNDEAVERFTDLDDWLSSGGFLPHYWWGSSVPQ